MVKNNNIASTVSAWTRARGINQRFFTLLGILFILSLVKVLIASQYELVSEEAQYWLWSKHLQLSYYSKPPLIAYLNWLSTTLLGDTVGAIRINAVILGFLTSIFTYLLAWELFKDQPTAFLAAVLTNIFPFLLHSSIIFTPDSPLLLFWIGAMFFFWKAAQTGNWEWWILFGLSVGLGSLSKYTIFLIFIPLALFSWKYHRETFKSRGFFLSILIALLLFSPVIYWNIRQNGVGLLHLIHLAGFNNYTQSVGKLLLNLLVFTAGQGIILLPFYQYPLLVRKFRQNAFTKEEMFLLLPVISMFIFFLLISMIRHSGAYMNWAMFAYTGMPILFAHFAFSGKKVKLNLQISTLVAIGVLLFISFTLPANKIIPLGTKNPANKMIGWAQLAANIDSLKRSFPDESCYVFSTSYHIASELSFYMEDQPQAYFLNMNSRMTQFDLWRGTEQFINTGKTGILVDWEKITPAVREGYSTILKEDSCLIYSQDRCIKTYYITLVQGLKGFEKNPSSY